MTDEFRLRPYEEMEHHPVADKLAQILCQKNPEHQPIVTFES